MHVVNQLTIIIPGTIVHFMIESSL